MMTIKLKTVSYNTNGVIGDGFYVVTFAHNSQNRTAIVFAARGESDISQCTGHIAILDWDAAHRHVCASIFEPQIRQWIARHHDQHPNKLTRNPKEPSHAPYSLLPPITDPEPVHANNAPTARYAVTATGILILSRP